MQTATSATLRITPSLRAMPVSVRTGPGRFWPQYWAASATRALPMDRANCCTTKNTWLTVAAADRESWLQTPSMMLSAIFTL